MTHQTHHQVTILIHLTTVITDTINKDEKQAEQGYDQTMRKFNGIVADDSISIKNNQVQNGQGSAPVPYLFYRIRRSTGNDIFAIHRNL